MKALEFEGRLTDRNHIEIPADLAAQVPEGSDVRVILLFAPEDDGSWRQLSLRRFSAAYADQDAVYESLMHGPEPR